MNSEHHHSAFKNMLVSLWLSLMRTRVAVKPPSSETQRQDLRTQALMRAATLRLPAGIGNFSCARRLFAGLLRVANELLYFIRKFHKIHIRYAKFSTRPVKYTILLYGTHQTWRGETLAQVGDEDRRHRLHRRIAAQIGQPRPHQRTPMDAHQLLRAFGRQAMLAQRGRQIPVTPARAVGLHDGDQVIHRGFAAACILAPILGILGNLVAIQPGRICLLYTSPSPRDRTRSRMPSSA